jgi:hypothetical protein
VVPHVLAFRAQRTEVGTGSRLGEALAPDLFARQRLLKVLGLLLVGAVNDDRRTRHPQADDSDVVGGFGAGGFLQEDRLMCVGSPCAAELLRPRQPRVTGFVEFLGPLARDLLFHPPPGGTALAPPLGKIVFEPFPKLRAELRLFGRVAEIHVSPCRCSIPEGPHPRRRDRYGHNEYHLHETHRIGGAK